MWFNKELKLLIKLKKFKKVTHLKFKELNKYN